MVNLFWLNEAEWAAIRPHLPMRHTGPERVDDRRVLSGIIHVLRSGCRWRDCPAAYGPPTTVYNRFNLEAAEVSREAVGGAGHGRGVAGSHDRQLLREGASFADRWKGVVHLLRLRV